MSYLLLSKGGINFFSKNFDLTMILRNFLTTATESIVNDSNFINIVKEENFFTINNTQSVYNLNYTRNLIEHQKYSLINKVIINMNTLMVINDDLLVKINLLQLKHLLEILFVVNYYLISSLLNSMI